MEISINIIFILNKLSSDSIARERNLASGSFMMERENEESIFPVIMEICSEWSSREFI